MPRVTVLLCVYNAERYLKQSIDSILAQTFRDFELLIVNDGSTDASRSIVEGCRDPRIRLIDNPQNIGLTRSLNRGLELAKGELIARQDADDLSHPERLRRQVAFMDANPDVCVLGTQARFIDSRGRPKWVQGYDKASSPLGIRWQLMFDSPFVHTSVMFRREWVRAEGGYNTEFITSQDFELWSRLAHRYRLTNLPERLVALRLHSGSVTTSLSPSRLAGIKRLMHANFVDALPDYPHANEWIDLWWLRIYNCRVYGAKDLRGELLLQHLTSIRGTFFRRHAGAAEDRDIRRLQPALLIRCAFALATVGAPGYWKLLRSAAAFSPVQALVAAPRILAYSIRRLLTQRRTSVQH